MDNIPTTTILFNQKDLQALKNRLATPQRATLIGHVTPDGDSLGSTLALAQVLQKLGHATKVVHPTAFPSRMSYMKGAKEAIIARAHPEEAAKALTETDTIFLMDFNDPKRVEQLEATLTASKAFKVMIDHHLHPTDMVDLCFSYANKSATSLIVYELLEALGWERYIDQAVAECIYTGMSTDTGGFSYNSEDPKIYTTISALLKHGLKKDAISDYLTRSYNIDKIKLNAHLMANNLTFYPQYHTAIITMSKEVKEQFHYQVGDTEGLVNEPLAAKEIRFSIFLYEQALYTKLSLRSKGTFPANQFAQRFFEGGGHINAAGAEIYAPIEKAKEMVLEAVQLMHPTDE